MKRLLVVALLFASPALAQRSLEWESIAVKARLDDRGALHVREEQTYVFNGAWNGGERVVRLERGQRFDFGSLSRRADEAEGGGATPDLIPLALGDLDQVDEYVLFGEAGIRWRSRMPSDRPFHDRRITYVIEYTLSSILLRRGGQYRLAHDFAFPDRPGPIRKLTVDLELDPSWRSDSLQPRYEGGPLAVGKGFVVAGTLDYRGSGPPPEAQLDTSALRWGLVAILVVVPLGLWLLLLRREEKLGRFAPLATSGITPQWIEENLLTVPAEVAGAVWDEDVGSAEVSALLARWVAEGKMSSSAPSRREMHLELNVPRETFAGYERDLIDKLFFSGEQTSSSAIRAHYASSGFSPTQVIRSGLLQRAGELAQLGERAVRLGALISVPCLVAAVYFLYRGWTAVAEHTGMVIVLVVMAVFSLGGRIAASVWRGRIDQGRAGMAGFQTIVALVVVAAIAIVAGNVFPFETQAGFAAYALLTASAIVDGAKSRRGRSAVAFRKRLAAARQYFAEELRKRDPAIDDRWFPWIVAFGLDKQASKWASEFGVRPPAAEGRTADFGSSSGGSWSSPSSSSSGAPTWSGGGGAFGGAGASGSWTVAASGLAAGVAAPSSSGSSSGGGSSSSGSSSSSSSSSGGGSGGGW